MFKFILFLLEHCLYLRYTFLVCCQIYEKRIKIGYKPMRKLL